jgi:hypothetical protein
MSIAKAKLLTADGVDYSDLEAACGGNGQSAVAGNFRRFRFVNDNELAHHCENRLQQAFSNFVCVANCIPKFCLRKIYCSNSQQIGLSRGDVVGMYQAKKEPEGADVCERAMRHERETGM